MSATTSTNTNEDDSSVNGYELYVDKALYTVTKDASRLARESNVVFLLQIPVGRGFKDILVFSIKQILYIFHGSMSSKGNVDSYKMYRIPQDTFAECPGESFEDKLQSFTRSALKMSFQHDTILSTFLIQAEIIPDDEEDGRKVSIEYWPKLYDKKIPSL